MSTAVVSPACLRPAGAMRGLHPQMRNAEEAQPLLDDLAEVLQPEVTVLGEIGPGLGVHVGPGTVGVCWLPLPA